MGRESINAAVGKMKSEGQLSTVDLTGQVEVAKPRPRKVDAYVDKPPTMSGQWTRGTHGHPFDHVSRSNVAARSMLVDATLIPRGGSAASPQRRSLPRALVVQLGVGPPPTEDPQRWWLPR
jgi:hypothetical protein